MPEESEEIDTAFEHAIIAKNTLTEVEFNRYRPLFEPVPCLNKKDPAFNQAAADSYRKKISPLAVEWRLRVSLYDPVLIVNQDGVIVHEIPPTIRGIPPVNTLISSEATKLVFGTLVSAQQRSTPARDLMPAAMKPVRALVRKAIASRPEQTDGDKLRDDLGLHVGHNPNAGVKKGSVVKHKIDPTKGDWS